MSADGHARVGRRGGTGDGHYGEEAIEYTTDLQLQVEHEYEQRDTYLHQLSWKFRILHHDVASFLQSELWME